MSVMQRRKERVYPRACTAAWGPASGGALTPARIRDVSESGVALCVRDARGITLGQPIRVLSSTWPHARRARVVRVDSEHGRRSGSTTVGCRWIGKNDRKRSLESRTRVGRERHQAASQAA